MLGAACKKRKSEIAFRPGAVPNSLLDFQLSDDDGNQLFAVTCITEDVNDYMKVLRKHGFTCQRFDYDLQAYNQKELDR